MTNASICLTVFLSTIIVPSALSFSINTSAMTNAGYQLRPYDPTLESDRSSLEEICANAYGGGDYLPKMASSYAADPACSFLALTKNDDNKNAATTEANDGDEIVAVANYKRLPAQSSAWIEAVRTHPDHRNQGLASTLLRSLVELTEQENDNAPPTNLLTCTSQSNTGMLRALEKERFAQCNTIQLLNFGKIMKLPGWKSDSDEKPQPLLDALNLKHLVSPIAKKIASSSWCTISTEQQLLERLQQCKEEGDTCGYLPGLYEYIAPGPNRLDLKRSLEQGLVLVLDLPRQKETSSCETENVIGNDFDEGKVGQAILVLTQDERISELKSKWVCSIVAHTQLAFEAALWHAHSPDVARRMESFQHGDGDDTIMMKAKNENADSSSTFYLVFDDAVPLTPGTLAHALPRVTDECVVYSYQHEGRGNVP
mmetsp:Transcript_36593/g.67263  ORF Transcript_36593/g.67263 Transcript_36593/m.67263 type:complete len:427 (-) Transcript_36593:351-1631(-)